jgi:hypothetical protein
MDRVAPHPPKDEVVTAIPANDRRTVTGPAGTLVFPDTSGFHRGGFASGDPRISMMSMYLSPAARTHSTRRFEVEPEVVDAAVPPSVRFALVA